MGRPKKQSSLDPLIAALIEKLPPAGAAWPVEKQIGWLNLTAMAFEQVYGGDATARLATKAPEARKAVEAATPAPAAAPAPAAKPKIVHPFYIDEQGYVRNKKGQNVNPGDVTDAIFDTRGEADLNTIIWEDGTIGLGQHDLMITC